MAFNIMDLISEQITPENIAIVTRFAGVDSPAMSKAIAAAIPLLLGNILGSTTEPAGKERFNKTIDEADTGLLGSFAGALSGDSGNSLASAGTAMLGSLLGDDKLASITKAISSFSGISSDSSTSLLGIAAPMLMSILSKKKQDDGLDNDGLLSILSDQQSNISGAMTPEMSHSFSGHGVLGSFLDQAGEHIESTAGNIVTDTAQQAAQATADTALHATNESKSLFRKLFPVIALALIAWLAYQFFTKPSAPTGPPRSPVSVPISPAVK